MDNKFIPTTLFQQTIEGTICDHVFIENNLEFCKYVQTLLNDSIPKVEKKIKQDKFDKEAAQYVPESIKGRQQRAHDIKNWTVSSLISRHCDNDSDDCVYRSCMMKSDVNIYRLNGTSIVLCQDCLNKNYNTSERINWLIERRYGESYKVL